MLKNCVSAIACLSIMFFAIQTQADAKTIIDNTLMVSSMSLMKPYKDASLHPILLSKMKKNANLLSEQDRDIIRKYVFGAVRGEDTFLLINCYLRGNLHDYIPPKEISKPLGCRLGFYAEGLRKSIAKSKIPQNVILYKALPEKDLNCLFSDKNVAELISAPVSEKNAVLLNNYLHNFKYTDKGFLLTTYDKNSLKSSKFVLELKVPQNVQAVLLDTQDKKDNKEVIINEGYRWEIVNVSQEYNRYSKDPYYNIVVQYAR